MLPADLGFYDLRLPGTRAAQADLAKQYGLFGFCYWHYWLNGRRLLELPFNEVLRTGEPDFPFCLAWANHHWERNWGQGKDQGMLIEQSYSKEDDIAHIRWMIHAFRDRRYISVNGKPLLLVYRVNTLPNPKETARVWRQEVANSGLPGLYLCTVTSLPELDFDPTLLGFDAAVEFQPNWGKLPTREPAPRNTLLGKLHKSFAPSGREIYWKHAVRSYPKVAEAMMALPDPLYKRFPCVIPGWDNSPRRDSQAHIFIDNTPEIYGRWLQHAVAQSGRCFKGDERMVFINAWNEWAEGNHLEPDLKWGHRFLEETAKAIKYGNQR